MFRVRLIVLAVFVPLLLYAEIPPILDSLKGRWVGNFEVTNAREELVLRFPVEHRYWVEENRLQGLATTEIDNTLLFTHSTSYLEEGELISEVNEEGAITRFIGTLKKGTLVWTPVEAGNPIRETLIQQGNSLILKIEYRQEIEDPEGELTTLTFTGLLRKTSPKNTQD